MPTLENGPLSLAFRMEPKAVDEKARTVEAAISNATPVSDALFGVLSLVHDADAIDLSRAENGLVMLFNHDRDNPIGRVENIRLDPDETLRGTFRFSEHGSAERYWTQVQDGTLTDISVGADVLEFEEGDDMTRITRWQPFEASIVSIGRIPTAKIGLSHSPENPEMTDETKSGDDKQPETKTAAQVLAAKSRNDRAQQATGADGERKRVKAIRSLFAKPAFESEDFTALETFCIDEGLSVEQAQTELLDFIGLQHEVAAPSTVPFNPQHTEPQVSYSQQPGKRFAATSSGQTNDEKVYDAMQTAIEFKLGMEKDIDRNNPYAGLSFAEMARHFAKQAGLQGVDFATPDQVMRAVFDPSLRLNIGPTNILMQHSTGDWPGILANVIDKQIRVRYEQSQETWRSVSRVGSVNDFRRAERPAVTAFDDLLKVPEGGEYKHGEQSDLTEYLTASKWGRIFSVTREALLADDLSALSDQSMRMAMSANRLVGDKVWEVFTSNPTLNQDGLPVFDPGHANEGTAGAPSVTTLSEARRLMRVQTDPSGKSTLNLAPALLIVPPGWETEALTLITAQNLDYTVNTGDEITQQQAANQFGSLTPVVENRLGGATGMDTTWYMQSAPNGPVPFVEVAFVRGQETPSIETREGFNVDGLEYKIRQEFGVAPLAYQCVVRNAGA